MPVAKSPRNGSIHYEVVGKGAPVAMIAGMGGAASYWKPQVAAFSERFRLVLHDQRGSGGSSMDRIVYDVPQMGDDFIAVLDNLRIEKIHCVGHAVGAVITQDVALRHPDRIASAVMVGAWARVDPYFRRVFEIRKDLLRHCGRMAYVRAMPLFLNTPDWVSRNIAAIEAGEAAFADHLSPDDILLSRIDAFSHWEAGEKLAGLRCPVLVCAAEDDHLVPVHCSHDLARLIPGAKAHYFATGGHSVSQTHAETFNAVVLRFLDDVTAAGRR